MIDSVNVRLVSMICLISLNYSGNSEAEENIDNIVVTGHNITFDDANTQAFGEEYIFEKVDGNLIDLFRGMSGIDVSQVGGDGGITFLSIRGGEPNFTTILIDGVAVNNSSNSRGGAFDFSSLDPAMIERVEVVKGPASPEIGSGAVSGIVNLITHKAREQEKLSARSYYGTNHSYNISTRYARPMGQNGDMSIGSSYTRGGDDIEGNKLQRININFGGGTAFSESLKIRTNIFYSEIDAENFPEDSGGPNLSLFRENQIRNSKLLSANANLSYQVNDKLKINSIYNISRINEDVFTPAIAPGVLDGVPPYLSDTQFNRDEIIVHGIYQLNNSITLNSGISLVNEKGVDDGFVDFGAEIPTKFSLNRNTKSVFAEVKFSDIQNCDISFSVRSDNPDVVDREFNASAAMECRVTSNGPSIIASWGEGFKLPSFFAIGNPLVGNPDLKPERSSNVELGIKHIMLDGRFSFDLRFYKNRFTDLIDFDSEIFRNVNRDKVEVKGIEADTRITLSKSLMLDMNLSYSDVKVVNSDIKLRRRPKWKGSVNASIVPMKDTRINIFAEFNGAYFDSSIVTGSINMDGFNSVKVSVIRDINNSLRAKLTVGNVFNKSYEEVIGFPASGRIARLGLDFVY